MINSGKKTIMDPKKPQRLEVNTKIWLWQGSMVEVKVEVGVRQFGQSNVVLCKKMGKDLCSHMIRPALENAFERKPEV